MMSRLTRDRTAEPISRDQILRHVRGRTGNIYFPCSADREQDWQPYPVDPYSAICDDHTYIHTVHTYIYCNVHPTRHGLQYPPPYIHTYIHTYQYIQGGHTLQRCPMARCGCASCPSLRHTVPHSKVCSHAVSHTANN